MEEIKMRDIPDMGKCNTHTPIKPNYNDDNILGILGIIEDRVSNLAELVYKQQDLLKFVLKPDITEEIPQNCCKEPYVEKSELCLMLIHLRQKIDNITSCVINTSDRINI